MPADSPPADEIVPAANVVDLNADIGGLGYEQARDELVDIVARLESGQVGLEASMTLWQRGEALADHCAAFLDQAAAGLAAAEGGEGS